MESAERLGEELRKFVAPEFIFGQGARLSAGRALRNLGGSKVLVVSDHGVTEAGWLAEATASLAEEGFACSVFSDVSPNPRDHQIMAGAAVFAQTGCDCLLAVGGGSVMDCAKGIGIVAANRGHILEFEGIDRVPNPMPPLVCVPTTGGTSADVSQFAIITNTQDRVKFAIISKSVVPDIALIDPVTLTSMDPFLTACTGMDALVHAMEAFVSNASSPFTDMHALEAIRRVSRSLQASVASPNDVALRSEIMFGSLQAGLAFSNASLGGVHAMAHSLGGYLDLPHGECNAILLASVVDFNYPASPERYGAICEALGLDVRGLLQHQRKSRLMAEIARLRAAVGIDATLQRRGLSRTDIPTLARAAYKDPCIVTNPRPPNRRDIETLFEETL